MLDALCLQHLLSQLAGDNLSLYFRDFTDQALDGKSTKKVHGIGFRRLTFQSSCLCSGFPFVKVYL